MNYFFGGFNPLFIEGLRRAKNKWRIGVSILLGLIVISLVLSFAYFGQSMGTNGGNTENMTTLEMAEATAEAAADAAKSAEGDATVLGNAAAAYLSLGAYQELYLEDPSDSYEKALEYAKEMVAACGSTPDADYATAYDYVFEACSGLGDADALSAAFNEALVVVTLDETFVNNYYQYMYALGAYELIKSDLEAAKAIAEKEAPAVDEEAETTEGEDGEDGEDGEETSLVDYIDELIVSVKVAVDTAE